ncbi:MAG TPA: hypothetical protein VLE99_06190 [Candidatus Saccharimonadales bacterium]|nr:hypothetical protein [Candidatus Saccharimonadales bacterium]
MTVDDLFVTQTRKRGIPFLNEPPTEIKYKRLNAPLLEELMRSPHISYGDFEVCEMLLGLVSDSLLRHGTGGTWGARSDFKLSLDAELETAIRCLIVIASRLGFQAPQFEFRNFLQFEASLKKKHISSTNGWERQRDYVNQVLMPLTTDLDSYKDKLYIQHLSQPAEPGALAGWPQIQNEIAQLRLKFVAASTEQDYNAIGTVCVRIIEGISRTAYNTTVHLRQGESEPPVNQTDNRIGRVIEVGLAGSANLELKHLAKSASAAAHRVKHKNTPTRLQAGIAADATILLTSIVSRIVMSETSA